MNGRAPLIVGQEMWSIGATKVVIGWERLMAKSGRQITAKRSVR